MFDIPFISHGLRFVAGLDLSNPEPVVVRRGTQVIARCAKSAWQPWKLEVADVDGDGQPEIIVGVKKSTRYLKQPHTTTFVYSFDGHDLTKKWLGSTLGRPLLEFCFGPPKTGGQDLFTLQATERKTVALCRYHWHNFGFRLTSRDIEWNRAKDLRIEGNLIAIIADDREIKIDPKTIK